MNRHKQYRFSLVRHVGRQVIITRVASESVIKYMWHRIRGEYEYGRGNSYEYNDIERW